MPQVPVYLRDVAARPTNQQNVRPVAGPDAFGAGIGTAMQSVSRGLGQAADVFAQLRAREDEAAAKEAEVALAEKQRNILYDPETGFMYTQGRSAVDGQKDVQKQLEAARAEVEGELAKRNPRAAQLFGTAGAARTNAAVTQTMQHGGQARVAVIQGATEALAQSLADDALVAYADPKAQQAAITAGLAQIDQLSADKGLPPEMAELARRKYETNVRSQIALRIAMEDAEKAQAYLDQHKDSMEAVEYANLTEKLRTPIITQRAAAHAGRILAGGPGRATTSEPSAGTAAGPRSAGGEMDLATGVIAGYEGFRSTPYWDVDHDRVGFGSDTVTLADGTVVKTRKGMTVTREDAMRDLNRRTQAVMAANRKAIGEEAYDGLDAATKAALASVAYNYGQLPAGVRMAASMGDKEQIAQAIERLQTHNDGINRNRRLGEANMVRTGQLPAGRKFTSVRGGVSPSQIFDALNNIADPEEREATRKILMSALEMQSKVEAEMVKAAKTEAFQIIQNGGNVLQIPAALQAELGMEGMSSVMTYAEKRERFGEIQTDQSFFASLVQQSWKDPQAFVEADTTDWMDKLSPADFQQMVNLQRTVATGDQKQQAKGATMAQISTHATNTLDAVGLTAKTDEDKARRARFELELQAQVNQFEEVNGRLPTLKEAQSMTDALLLPYIVSVEKSWWPDSRQEVFGFELGTRPDGSKVTSAIEYTDIPIDTREMIRERLQKRPMDPIDDPTPEQIVAEYARMVLRANEKLFEESR